MTAPAAPARLARRLAGSPLLAHRGWLRLRLIPDTVLPKIADEAFRYRASAVESVIEEPIDDDPRHGHPDRRLESAPGGAVLSALYLSDALSRLLEALTATPWRPSGPQASYSYYRAQGHYLGLHLDVDVCDLAVIVGVSDEGPGAGSANLCLYPDRAGEPLADIRENRSGQIQVAIPPGDAVILLGGVIPHEVRPVRSGRCRIIAPMCFQPVL